ncbi:MAG: glycosyltransferase [Caldilineaceae bacterium]|nr:glycosyltransferase [Caldilineaceae bacterium]
MGNFTVSVITTVYNERPSIEALLHSLATQTRRPDEVIICDGGSTDGTVAAIEAWHAAHREQLPKLRVLIEPGANISRGRNSAIHAAHGPIIAATDAGVRLTPTWLAALVAPWEARGPESLTTSRLPAVAGFFLADTTRPTSEAVEMPSLFLCAMAATVLPLPAEIDPQKFLPSSRSVAFTKAAWAAAGGYPEWLDYCEDLIFDFAINAQVPTAPTGFAWAPTATVYFRPRGSLRSFWTQYYRYARGDGKADLWRKRHWLRYITYFVVLPALVGHAFWGFFARWLGWAGLLAGIGLYCLRPWLRLRTVGKELSPTAWLLAALLVPLIRLVGDVAKMTGYPVGRWWRWRHRHRAELDWRRPLGKPE